MSFFLEAKRNTDFPVAKNPSPFDYSINPQRKKSNSYAPFSSTSKLNRSTPKIPKHQKINDNVEQDQGFVIDENNIQILAQQRMQSMFKSRSERIMHTHNNVPGPGSYELKSKYKSGRSKKIQSYNHSISTRKMNPPSIPTDNLGYKYNSDTDLQKVKPKQVNPPVPGSYEIRKDLVKQHGLAWNNNITASRKQDDIVNPGPGTYNFQSSLDKKAPTSIFKSQIDRFNAKKIKKILNPGPGQYETEQKKPFRQFSESHFNSKAPRFAVDKPSNIGPGVYNQNSFNKSLNTFNKKIAEAQRQRADAYRKTIFNSNNKNPGPGQYIARQGMTFELQKALLRKHNISQFANSGRQVFETKNQDDPGPGAYDPAAPKGTQKGNIGYKKIDVINLKQDDDTQQPTPMTYTYNNFSMSKKIQQSSKRITLTDKKPFNIGAQRFTHYEKQTAKRQYQNESQRKHTYDTDNNRSLDIGQGQGSSLNFEGPKRVKKFIMTSVKVKVPFGTSTSKFQPNQYNEVGPGHYNSGSEWIKKSYSLKGKLNSNPKK